MVKTPYHTPEDLQVTPALKATLITVFSRNKARITLQSRFTDAIQNLFNLLTSADMKQSSQKSVPSKSPVSLIPISPSVPENPGFCHFSNKLAGMPFLCSMQKTLMQRGL